MFNKFIYFLNFLFLILFILKLKKIKFMIEREELKKYL